MADHKENVIQACRELGGYEVISIVAKWLIDELLPSPQIQLRQDVRDRVRECAQDVQAAANKMLL